jgi:hypothetical protein
VGRKREIDVLPDRHAAFAALAIHRKMQRIGGLLTVKPPFDRYSVKTARHGRTRSAAERKWDGVPRFDGAE